MFISLFSNYVYGEEKWSSVFQFENLIHAVLREHWRDMIGISDDKMIEIIKAHVSELAIHAGQAAFLNDALITEILEHEVGRIAKFVVDIQGTNPREESGKLAAYFNLNAQMVQDCMMKSNNFRDFINNKQKN